NYKAEALNEAPPNELAAPVRNELSASGIRVTGPSGTLCDLWLGKAVPGNAKAPQSLGVVFPQFAPGTLMGAIRFPNPVKDYRKQEIDRKSTRLNSSHLVISYAVFCLKKKKNNPFFLLRFLLLLLITFFISWP